MHPEVKTYMQSFPRFPRDDGKGKYRITVPEPFNFDKRDKIQAKTKRIREQKLEDELKWKDMEIEYEMAQQFRAKKIPKSTLEPRFERICQENEDRRLDVKKQSIALTKANERPFSFYYRDLEKYMEKSQMEIDPRWDVMNHPPFKANEVPYYCKIEKFRRMMENDAQERE